MEIDPEIKVKKRLYAMACDTVIELLCDVKVHKVTVIGAGTRMTARMRFDNILVVLPNDLPVKRLDGRCLKLHPGEYREI